MLIDFGYIGLFLIFSLLVASSMVLIPVLLRLIGIIPKNPNPVKNSPFECGMHTIGKTWIRFNFRYYFYALMFIALDVLVLFLYPWAVGTRESGYFRIDCYRNINNFCSDWLYVCLEKEGAGVEIER